MSNVTGKAADTGPAAAPVASGPVVPRDPPDLLTRIACWSSAIGITSSIVIMIAAAAARNSWSAPRAALPATGPPWGISPHLPFTIVTLALWAAAVLGGGGVAAGLIAVGRGARPPARLLITASLAAVAVLTVLPPAGSTDALDYAVYGRIVELGHSPYLMTPAQLQRADHPAGLVSPATWQNYVSVYGPAATAEQLAAAELGGTSALRTAFWLKLWASLGFGVVLLALDLLLRADPGRRARAHLLWSVNPLLLWILVAAGHVDLMPAAAGLLGLVVLGGGWKAGGPPLGRALAAGLLVGLAADFRITYVLFGAGIAWATRRCAVAMLTAAAGALAVLVPSYLWFGLPAVRALVSRSDAVTAQTSFYRLLHVPPRPGAIVLLLSAALFAVVGALMLRRLPDGVPALPAIQPALALSIAWLFVWSYQQPWYDTMAICLLALFPASRLDWLVLGRLFIATATAMPGTSGQLSHMSYLAPVYNDLRFVVMPAVMLAAVASLVWLCLSRAWQMSPPAPRQAKLTMVI